MTAQVLVNTREAYAYAGTGIKYFTRALIKSIAREFKLFLLLESAEQKDVRKGGGALLSASNAFNVHHQRPSVSAFACIRDFLGFTLLPKSNNVRLERVLSEDSLREIALQRIGLEPDLLDAGQGQIDLFVGYKLFANAEFAFASTRRLTNISIKGVSPARPLIFHNASPFPLFCKGAKNVLTVHDTIPLTHPEFTLSNPALEFSLLSQLVSSYDAFHLISQASAENLCRIFGSSVEKKIHVFPQATTSFRDEVSLDLSQLLNKKKSIFRKFAESGRGTIVQLGAIEPKKNHIVVLDAFQNLREEFPGLELTIVGKEGWLCSDVLSRIKASSDQGVRYVGVASRSYVLELLRNSLALVFPSLVEGWGLPPLEAMSLATPAVVSSIPACLEACGSAPVYVRDYRSPLAWRNSLKLLLNSETFYMQKALEAFSTSDFYTEAKFGADLARLYDSML